MKKIFIVFFIQTLLLGCASLDKYIEKGQYHEAEIFCSKQKGEKQSIAYSHLARVLENSESKYIIKYGDTEKKAAEFYIKANDPNQAGHIYLKHLYDYENAAIAYIKASNTSGLDDVAEQYLEKREYEKAFKCYIKIDSIKSGNVNMTKIYLKMAKSLFEKNDWEEAAKYYEKADDKDGLNKVAKAFLDKKDYKNSEIYFRKTLVDEKEIYKMFVEVSFVNGDYDNTEIFYPKSGLEGNIYEKIAEENFLSENYDTAKIYFDKINKLAWQQRIEQNIDEINNIVEAFLNDTTTSIGVLTSEVLYAKNFIEIFYNPSLIKDKKTETTKSLIELVIADYKAKEKHEDVIKFTSMLKVYNSFSLIYNKIRADRKYADFKSTLNEQRIVMDDLIEKYIINNPNAINISYSDMVLIDKIKAKTLQVMVLYIAREKKLDLSGYLYKEIMDGEFNLKAGLNEMATNNFSKVFNKLPNLIDNKIKDDSKKILIDSSFNKSIDNKLLNELKKADSIMTKSNEIRDYVIMYNYYIQTLKKKLEESNQMNGKNKTIRLIDKGNLFKLYDKGLKNLNIGLTCFVNGKTSDDIKYLQSSHYIIYVIEQSLKLNSVILKDGKI